MTAKPTDAERITEVIRPTLDAFTIAAEPHVRKVAESLYEHLLGMTQDYLRENAEWNLGEEVLRCRRTEIENINLREEIAALRAALVDLTRAVGDWARPTGANGMVPVRSDHPVIVAAMKADAALSREAHP